MAYMKITEKHRYTLFACLQLHMSFIIKGNGVFVLASLKKILLMGENVLKKYG